jgi:Protein of unknown function (DUF2987)
MTPGLVMWNLNSVNYISYLMNRYARYTVAPTAGMHVGCAHNACLGKLGLLVLLSALFAGSAMAADYRDFYKPLEAMSKLDGLRYMKPRVRVSSKLDGVRPESIRITIHAKAGDLVVPVDAEGQILFPITQALYDENPPSETNQPKGTVSLNVSFDVNAPPQQNFDYALLTDMLADYREGVSRQGMLARMMMPSPKGFLIKFDPDAHGSATLTSASGDQRIDADADGTLRLADSGDLKRSNPRIALSGVPKEIGLDFGK